MSKNADVRTVIQTGTRRVGFGLDPEWFRAAGVGKGDDVGIRHLDAGELEVVLDEYDRDAIDAEVRIGSTGCSLTLDLDKASRFVLGEDLGGSIYARRRDDLRVLVKSTV